MSKKTNNLTRRYRNYDEFRLLVNVLVGACASAAIGVYDLILSVINGASSAIWLFTLAIYFFTLAVVRLALLATHRYGVKHLDESRLERQTINIYLSGGALIVPLTFAYSGIAVLVASDGFHYTYRGYMIFGMATYAFYKIIVAIVNAVRMRRQRKLIWQTFRNVNIVDSMVSLMALQSALLFAYSSDETFVKVMNIVVGGVAGILMLALGTYMIVRGWKLRGKTDKEVDNDRK